MTEQECANNLDNLHKKIVRNYEIASKVTEKEVMSLVRAKKLLEELEQYRALGTVEELRVARDKQIPKKPKCFDDFEAFECPSCGKTIIALDDMSTHKHCLLCGQKLNWEEV